MMRAITPSPPSQVLHPGNVMFFLAIFAQKFWLVIITFMHLGEDWMYLSLVGTGDMQVSPWRQAGSCESSQGQPQTVQRSPRRCRRRKNSD